MSFTPNKPTMEGGAQTAWNLQPAGLNSAAPAFKPQIVRSVLMYPKLAACVASVVLLTMVGVALMQRSIYLAISQVNVEPTAAKFLSDPAPATFDANKYENFLAEQTQLMQRLDVLTAAMTSLPASTYREFGATPAQAAEAIQAQLKVVRVASSYQVSISLKGTDAQNTADIVNAITSAYVGTVRKTNAEEYDQRTQLLGEERQRIETELQAARSEQTTLGASIGVANPTDQSGNPYDAELNGIRLQLTEARAAHDVAAAQLASLSGVGASRADGLTAAADELIAGDAGLGSMKATISQRKAQLGEQMSGMTTTNPIYKQDQDEIADLDRTLDRMANDLRDKAARRLQDKLRTDLQRTGDIESRLNGQLARQIANATSAAPRLQRAGEVAADIKRLDARLAAVDDALRSLRMEVTGPSQVRLSLPATAPERPEVSRKKLLLLLALPLALVFGAAAAILARKRDQHIYAGIDMEEVLGFPPLAVLPARAEVSPGVFGEYVLRLAAGIESAYRNRGARTFLLTAVSMTTDIEPLAIALTRKFEEIGVNVIVATAAEMMLPTKGSVPTSPDTVPVWSEGFVAANVARMKAEQGLVLIDSEAILNCAQTEYVARCADATILMVECGVTTRQELFLAGELLHRLNVTGVGAVLEEVQLRFADAEFRKAIAALDRRQSTVMQSGRREPPPRAVVADLAEQPLQPQAPQAEPQAATRMAPSPTIPRVPPPTPQPVELLPVLSADALEKEGDRVELAYEPAHYDEVLHHVRASWPTEPDSGWHLPVFGQVGVTSETASASTVTAEPLVPTVEIESHATKKEPDSSTGGLVMSDLQPSLREKIVPRLSGRRRAPVSGGDASMARKASWLDKLLRRDSNAAISIIPDDSESDSSAGSGEEYDIPLANRLAQISGLRSVAPSAEPTLQTAHKSNVVDISHPHAVALESKVEQAIAAEVDVQPIPEPPIEFASVVASEPVAEESALSLPEPAQLLPEPAPVAAEPARLAEGVEVSTPKRASPSAWATVDVMPAESVVVPTDGSRRAYTFRELMEKAQQAELAAGEPVPLESFPVEAVGAIEQEAQSSEFHVLGQVSEFFASTPVIASTGAAHDRAASITSGAEPAVLGQVEGVAQEIPVPEARPEPPTVWARAPEFRFSEAPKPFLNPYDEVVSASNPSTPEVSDVDDIEPVYQAASRRLNSGRWDPIPPLRPSMASWRDRPSPAPFTRDSGGFRTDPAVKDAFNAFPPQRWIPEEDVFVSSEPQALSEPALSRQWGLLSKFQQSRLVSAGTESEAGKEKGRADFDPKGPGSTHGNRKS